MKLLNIFFIPMVLVMPIINAQPKSLKNTPMLSEASPESVGMSTSRLSRIDSVCNNAVSKGDIPGVVALVARNGKIVYYKAFGMADNQSGKPLKRDDIFRIASQTKGITATAVMMLWEEGKFQLNDPISKYIPEFKNSQVLATFNAKDTSYTTVPAKSEITIRQLLTHTSGLGYGGIDDDQRIAMIFKKAGIIDTWTTKNITIEENIKKLAKLPLVLNPGEKFRYSEGLDVLGYFVEIISGMPFDVFCKTRIFDPIGMVDTQFYIPESKSERLVSLQKPENGKWIPYPITFYDPDYPIKGAKKYLAGGAGLSSTAKDYALFLQMYLNGGEINGKRLLSRTTIQTMMSDQNGILLDNNNVDKFYGLAFTVVTAQGQNNGGIGSKGTFGWEGYFNTMYFADPKEKTIGIIMKQTQGQTSDETVWQFPVLVGQAINN